MEFGQVPFENTKCELAVQEILKSNNVSFETQGDLPGKPDIVIEEIRLCIFVHGCYWHDHGCGFHNSPSVGHAESISQKKVRDAVVPTQLKSMGWNTLVIWECETQRELVGTETRIMDQITNAYREMHMNEKSAQPMRTRLNDASRVPTAMLYLLAVLTALVFIGTGYSIKAWQDRSSFAFEIDAAESELSRIKVSIAGELLEYETARSAAAEMNIELPKLRSERDSFRQGIGKAREETAAEAETLSALSKRSDNAREEIADLLSERKEIEQLISSLGSEKALIESQTESSKAQQRRHETEANRASKNAELLLEESNSHSEDISRKIGELASLRALIGALEGQKQEATVSLRRLTDRVVTSESLIQDAREAEEQLLGNKAELELVNGNLRSNGFELKSLQSQVNKVKLELGVENDALMEAVGANKQQGAELTSVKRSIANEDLRLKETVAKEALALESLIAAQGDLARVGQELSSKRSERDLASSTLAALNVENISLESEATSLNIRIIQLEAEIKLKVSRLADLAKQEAEAKSGLSEFKLDSELRKQLAALSDSFQALIKSLQEATAPKIQENVSSTGDKSEGGA